MDDMRGCEVCRRMYVKPRLEEDSHLELLRKSKTVLNNRQMFSLKVKNRGENVGR
jgi:hypothetical protein